MLAAVLLNLLYAAARRGATTQIGFLLAPVEVLLCMYVVVLRRYTFARQFSRCKLDVMLFMPWLVFSALFCLCGIWGMKDFLEMSF
jgi:hypothetical protein